jgi:probable rRNA maturation factor
MTLTLDIQNQTLKKIPPKNELEKVVLTILEDKKINVDVEIGLRIVNLKEIKKLNKMYRKIDLTTDVLSFPIYQKIPKTKNKLLLGDIVICYEFVNYDPEVLKELLAHGMLHLLGYHHK